MRTSPRPAPVNTGVPGLVAGLASGFGAALVLWLVVAASAGAQSRAPLLAPAPPEPRYQVELIVFAHRDGLIDSDEDFLAEPDPPRIPPVRLRSFDDHALLRAHLRAVRDPETDALIDPETGLPVGEAPPDEATELALIELAPVRRIWDSEQHMLAGEWRRLNNRAAYATIAHIAWTQPIPQDQTLDAIAIDHARNADSPRVRGSARVSRSRFVHLHLDLELLTGEQPRPVLAPAVGRGDAVVGKVPRYRLVEQRRMRPGELHYFDHPGFGVIAKITRVALVDDQPDEDNSR